MDKLKRPQTKDRIAEMLRREILSGRIEDGQELTQEQLAETLKVSRMPVREALQILELEGLLVRLPNRHVRVVGTSELTIYENMRVIAAIEAEIALILIEKGIYPDDIGINDDPEFHNWFSRHIDNPYLRQILERLLKVYPQYAWEVCKCSGQFTEQNKRILESLYRGDSEATNRSIQEYYGALAQRMLYHIKECKHEQP